MCLSVVYHGKQKREALAMLPDEFPVWKAIKERKPGEWWVDQANERVYAGEQEASYLGPAFTDPMERFSTCVRPLGGNSGYDSGWHAFLTEPTSTLDMRDEHRCVAKKLHVRAIGEQNGHVVIVLSHITFPAKCGKAKKK